MNEVLKAIETRNSVRAYTAEVLSEETVNTLIETGLQAPTAANKQELHFSVVKKDCPALLELNAAVKAGRPGAADDFCFFYGADTVIFVSADDTFGWGAVDAGIAVQNMHLAAHSMGLGSVIIGCVKAAMTGEEKASFNEKLGIPAGYTYQIALAVGVPVVGKEPHTYDKAAQVTVVD